MQESNSTQKSTVIEKISYAACDLGQASFIYTFTVCFMTMFYTNSVGLSALSVGTMMLVCRLLDGISDVLMGVILEKTSTRFGKCRPWYLVSGIILTIALILCFRFPPNLSENGKVIYMYLTYILLNVIGYTIFSITNNAMLARMSTDPQDQSNIATIRLIASTVGANLIYYVTVAFMNQVGGMSSASAWAKVSTIYAIAGGVLIILVFFFVKEKVVDMPATGSKSDVAKVPLKTSFLVTVKNKEFFLLLAIWFCVYTISGAKSGSSSYYLGYVIGDWNAASWFSLGMMAFQLVGMLPVPFLLKKFDKIKLMRWCLILATIVRITAVLSPKNLMLYLVSSWLTELFYGPINVLIVTLLADLIGLIAKRSGVRAEGFAAIASSIGLKLGTGVGSAITGWLLGWGGYDGTAAVQSEGAIRAIIIDNVVITSVFMLLAVVFLFFWRPKEMQNTI